MKSRMIFHSLLFVCLLFLVACNEDGGSNVDDIAGSLSDELSDSLSFEGGEVVEGAPPEGESGDGAPQVGAIEEAEELILGQAFPLHVKLANPPEDAAKKLVEGRSAKYTSVSDVAYTIIWVEGASRYIRVDTDLSLKDSGYWAELFGSLVENDDLKGKSFRVMVAFQTEDGTTGLYKVWSLTIMDEDAVDPEEIARGLDIPNAEIVGETAPLGKAGSDAPQIIGIRGPMELAPGDEFSLVLLTDYTDADAITHAILAVPTHTGYLLVQSAAEPVEDGFQVKVPGQVPEGMDIMEWTMTFMVALRNSAGTVGQYRDWTFRLVSQTTIIEPPDCDDDNACTTDTLLDDGTCSYEFVVCDDETECTLDLCNPDSGDCEYFLDVDTCLIDGECIEAGTISEANQCEACLPEVSTETWSANQGATCDDGNGCTQTDICQGNQCIGGNSLVCEDGNSCRESLGCNPDSGECEYSNLDDGTACTADDSLCTVDTCLEGSCVAGSRTVCPAQTGNPCQESTGTCVDATGQCVYDNVEDGTACNLDNDQCTVDTCQQGQCVLNETVTCEQSDDPCMVSNVCNPQSGTCVTTMLPTGTLCHPTGEENLCLKYSCSDEGACLADSQTTHIECPAPGPCWEEGSCNPTTGQCDFTPKAMETACDLDGTACTPDLCDGNGVCIAGDEITCTPPGQCQTGGTCNARTGECVYVDKPEGAPCDLDENLCTLDQCDGAGTCSTGESRECDAPGLCEESIICNPQTGNCDVTLKEDATPCDLDESLCTPDYCDAGTCLAGEAITCDPPQNDCLAEGVCDPLEGSCVYAFLEDQTPCDLDENLCTLDTCMQGACMEGDQVYCEASGPCMASDGCDPQTGQCTEHVLDEGTFCDDMDEGTYASRCYGEQCVGFDWKKLWSLNTSTYANYAYSQDANRLAIATYDGELFLLDAYTGLKVGPTFPKAPVDSYYSKLVYSADGSRIAVATESPTRGYRLFDANTGSLLRAKSLANAVDALMMNDDGSLLGVQNLYSSTGIQIFDSLTGVVLDAVQDEYGGTPEYFAFQPGGNNLVTNYGSQIFYWYWSDEEQSYTDSDSLEGIGYNVTGFYFSADGSSLLATTTGCSVLYSFSEEGGNPQPIDGDINAANSNGMPPSGFLEVCGNAWGAEQVAMSPSGDMGLFLAQVEGYMLGANKLAVDDVVAYFPLEQDYDGTDVRALFISNDGLYGVVEAGALRVYSLGEEMEANLIHETGIGGDGNSGYNEYNFRGDGQTVVGNNYYMAEIFDSMTGKSTESIPIRGQWDEISINSIAMHPSLDQLAVSISQQLYIFEKIEGIWGEAGYDMSGFGTEMVRYSPSGQWLARVRSEYQNGYLYTLDLFEPALILPSFTPQLTLGGGSMQISDVTFSPDESYISYLQESQLIITNLSDTQDTYFVMGQDFQGYHWFSDGARLLIYSSNEAGIYDFPAMTSTPTYFTPYADDVYLYPDDSLIMSLASGQLSFWEPRETTKPMSIWSDGQGSMYDGILSTTGELFMGWGEMNPAMYQHQAVQCVAQLDGMPCDDGNPRTVSDRCLSGVCQGTACECESGPCCDGCHFQGIETLCGIEQESLTCEDPDGCQGTWTSTMVTTYCSGSSAQCDGATGDPIEFTYLTCSFGNTCGAEPGECTRSTMCF